MKKKPVKPKDVKTFNQLCAMPRDNWTVNNFCIGFNTESELYFHQQKVGEKATQKFLIPLRVFNQLCRKLGWR